MPIFSLTFIRQITQPPRLDQYIESCLPHELNKHLGDVICSRSKIRRLIIAGAVKVQGVKETRPFRDVKVKETVHILLDTEKFLFEKTPDDIVFEMSESSILFEDEHLILVNKPAGIPTEATIVSSRDHLHAVIKRYLHNRDSSRNEPYVGLHHRLDRETSGVILFTKTRSVNAAVHQLFLSQNITKEYTAFALSQKGSKNKKKDSFTVENTLGRISAKSAKGKWGAVTEGGDAALTNFTILEKYSFFNSILAIPRTGRTHQIRVHLSGLGMPILGDTVYGGPAKLPSGKTISRLCLHATTLTFPHPVSGKTISVSAPLPPDMQKIIEAHK